MKSHDVESTQDNNSFTTLTHSANISGQNTYTTMRSQTYKPLKEEIISTIANSANLFVDIALENYMSMISQSVTFSQPKHDNILSLASHMIPLLHTSNTSSGK